MNIAYSLSFMNVMYYSFLVSFLTIISYFHCNVFYWIEKCTEKFIKQNSKFSIYCSKSIIILSITNDTFKSLRILLTKIHININDKVIWIKRIKHFQKNIQSYNNMISFIFLDIKLDQVIIDIINTIKVYIFRI